MDGDFRKIKDYADQVVDFLEYMDSEYIDEQVRFMGFLEDDGIERSSLDSGSL